MKRTIEDAKRWSAGRSAQLDSARLSSTDSTTKMMNRIMPAKAKELWDSGCWLAEQLESCGANDEQIAAIQMAAGQRAFGGDAWKAAVDYANEFAENGDTEEKGGMALAEKRHRELFGESA